jgi:hypothetical protein
VLILKCPTDNDQIPTFLDVFPEAKLLLCHRDPFRTLTSSLRTWEVIHNPHLASPDAITSGANYRRLLGIHRAFAAPMVAAAEAMPDRVASVRYCDLMADPSETVSAAFRKLGVAVDPSRMQRAVARFVTDQQRGRRPAPPAGYQTYGHSAAEVRSDPEIAAYIETFSVPDEDLRISAPVVQHASP